MNLTLQDRSIYTVSELTENIKGLLEEAYPFIWIAGEISNFRIPISGHFYFILKDPGAQINAVMFRRQNQNLGFKLEDGMAVIAMGRLNVYEQRGIYQIIVEYVEPAGVGILQLAFEQLKAKLAKEGLFDDKHKRSIPFLPRKIGIVSSPTGAVIRDIMHVINSRFGNIAVEIAPAKVQGASAAQEVSDALKMLNERGDADVIIVARGGGSLEDMQAFNSEVVARAIFASRIPVVSAIGHETDFTIADFTADARAPTPSAAAAMILPVKDELAGRVVQLKSTLSNAIFQRLRLLREQVIQVSKRLVHPRRRIGDYRLRLDDITERILRELGRRLLEHRERLKMIRHRLVRSNPQTMVDRLNISLEYRSQTLLTTIQFYMESEKSRFRTTVGRLSALNPLAILKRGYSVTRALPDRSIVKDVEQVDVGQQVEVTVSRGEMICSIERKQQNGQTNI